MNFIAIWAATISTILAVVKLWEIFCQRFRMDVGSSLTSSSEIGNEIHLRNLAARPMILTHWELERADGTWPFRRYSAFCSPEGFSHDIRIEPDSSKTLSFTGIDHFDWGVNAKPTFIKLHFSGRRPQRHRVSG
jgi:hypothetical protein